MPFYGPNQDSTRTARTGYKNLFANFKVARAWTEQVPAKGRSANGNYAYDGRTLYSYKEPIALICTGRDLHDKKVALLTSETFSMTTTCKHERAAFTALHHGKFTMFRVPNIGDDPAYSQANLDYLMSKYNDLIMSLSKCSLRKLSYLTRDWHAPYYERTSLEDIEEAEQTQGYVARKNRDGSIRCIETFPYMQHETHRVQYLVKEELKRVHLNIVNFAFALKVQVPQVNVEADAENIMQVRIMREMAFWQPNKVRNRNTAYAKRLFKKLM